ncbi:YrdB family protein [Ilumatobacter sp.]|uniref:YrdB family protein n=1 Tax=Ilumatobacter sp. TaxID=1967498 RepID=UPI003AF9EA24
MNPPPMAGWNLGLRFGLEVVSLVALGAAAWKLAPGSWRWLAVGAVPLVAAALWTTFNVVGDPSRSGEAPVEVAGTVRLALELTILGVGAIALAVAGRSDLAGVAGVAIGLHYVTSWNRVQWLLGS